MTTAVELAGEGETREESCARKPKTAPFKGAKCRASVLRKKTQIEFECTKSVQACDGIEVKRSQGG